MTSLDGKFSVIIEFKSIAWLLFPTLSQSDFMEIGHNFDENFW